MREVSDYNLRHLIMRSFMRCMEKEGDSHDVRNCIREYSDVLTDHDLFEMAALCIQSHIGRKNSGKADADWLAFKEEWIDWELKRREGRRE